MLSGTLPWPPNEARLAFKEGQLPEAQVQGFQGFHDC